MTLVDPAVSNLISQLSQLQQTQETIFGAGTNSPDQQPQSSLLNPTQSMMQSRRQVSDLYERTKTRSQSSSPATNLEPYMYYRMACLAMLGGSESISEASSLESSGLVKTVEDYLYGSLWHALHLADASSSGMTGVVGGASAIGGGGGGLRRVAEAVARLSVLVNQWGPSYFEQDEDVNGTMYTSASSAVALAAQGGTVGGGGGAHKVLRSGGWAYTLPLLVSQQYASALAYLAEAGGGLGLLQACHLGVVMDVAGLSIGDFTLDNNDVSSSTQQQQQTLLPKLVASYSASLQGLDAGAALKYLVLLTDKGKFVKEQVCIFFWCAECLDSTSPPLTPYLFSNCLIYNRPATHTPYYTHSGSTTHTRNTPVRNSGREDRTQWHPIQWSTRCILYQEGCLLPPCGYRQPCHSGG